LKKQPQHPKLQGLERRRRSLPLWRRYRSNRKNYGNGKRKKHVWKQRRRPGKKKSDDGKRRKRSVDLKPRHRRSKRKRRRLSS